MSPLVSTGAVILVGGFGTRLRPLTLTRPKALMPVLNRPFLSFQFDLIRKAGIRTVVLAANPEFKKWKRQLQNICPKTLDLHFAFEKKPLGTGGAIRFGYDSLKKVSKRTLRTVVVLNGDILIDLDLSRALGFHDQKKSGCTLVLKTVSDVTRFGLVRLDSKARIHSFLEKPKNKKGPGSINAGLYLIESPLIEKIPSGKTLSVEREVFPRWLECGEKVFGYVMKGYWNDIGTPTSYLMAHRDLVKVKRFWTGKGFLCKGRSLSRDSQTTVKGFVCVGSRVSLGKDCSVEDSVLMDDVHVAQGAQLKGVVLGRACRIGKYAILGEGTVLGDRTIIPPHTKT